MSRIIVVDDRASQRDGRVSWLSATPGVQAQGMTFEQAVALGAGWRDVDIAVLDAHDQRSAERREQAAAEAGIDPIAPHDNYVGVRVAELIRLHSTSAETRIILISAVARDSDLRAPNRSGRGRLRIRALRSGPRRPDLRPGGVVPGHLLP